MTQPTSRMTRMENLAANLDQLDFPSVNSLIAFLAQVAEQKVIDEYRRQHTLKRDVTRERPIFGSGADGPSAQLSSDEPTASQLAQANEVHEWLLSRPTRPSARLLNCAARLFDRRYCRTNWLEHPEGTAVFTRAPRFAA